jgi:predicted PurR-regulated permease PerM
MISRQTVEQSIGVAILAVIVIGAFLVLRPFLSAIVWGAVLAYSTWPLFERLKTRLGGREAVAAALMILAITCLLLVPIAVLAWSMADEVIRLTAVVRGWFETGLPSLPRWVGNIPVFGGKLIQSWHDTFQTGDLAQNLSPYLATLRAQLLVVSTTVANALFELLLSLVLAFFFYCNGPEISAALTSMGVKLSGERGRRLIEVVASTVRSVIKGLLGTNLLQSILGALGFWLAGVPGAMLLGFFVFFLTVIPFGAGLVWIPAVLWVANTGNTVAAVLLTIWCILIFGLLENIARPFLIGRGSTLPALLILLGMLGGMTAFGFLGVFLGPALLALVYALLDEFRAPAPRVRAG